MRKPIVERLNDNTLAIDHAAYTVVKQGNTVIEESDGEFRIMHPDASVTVALNRADAEAKAKRWYQRHIGRGGRIGIGQIEWR